MTIPPGPLSYTGVLAVPFNNETFDPTSANYSFPVPTIWCNTSAGRIWALAKKPSNVADWVLLGSGVGSIATLTGNSGGAVPASLDNINVVGDTTTINVVGNPGTSTLTISVIAPLPVPSGGTGATTLTGVLIGHGTTAITGNPITQYDVLVGGASNAISSIGPGSSGQVFLSGGAAANPAYSTIFTVTDASFLATLTASAPSNVVTLLVRNTSVTNASKVLADAHSSAVADVGFFSSGQWDIPKYWNFGMTSTASAYANAFNISYATNNGAPEGGVVGISITPTGIVSFTNRAYNFPGTDGTVGQVLTTNGAGVLTFQAGIGSAFSSIVVQTKTTSGNYTPSVGTLYVTIQAIGGGAAGGGADATGGAQYSEGAGGGGGENAFGVFSIAQIHADASWTGTTLPFVIGAGGTGNSGADGGDGGNTTVGTAIISANGGKGGKTIAAAASGQQSGGAGGTGGAGGSYRIPGGIGGTAYMVVAAGIGIGGVGGNSLLGYGGGDTTGLSAPGNPGTGYGSGGSGGGNAAGELARFGGAGAAGVVIITEYI